MKKQIISAALCLMPLCASAEFTPYASILVGIENGTSFNQGTALDTKGQLQNATLIEDYGSFFGVRGQEILDPNLRMIWQLEQYITIDNSGVVTDKNTLANKDSYLGVSGNFGSVRLGRLSTIPKNDMEYVDPWEYDGKSVNGLSMFTRLDNRLNNALKYESPGYFGTKLIVLYAPDEAKDANGKAKDTFNAALLYKDATYFAAYSYYIKSNVHNGVDPDVWNRVEVGVDQQVWMLSLGYQTVYGYNTSLAYNPSAYEAQTGTALTGAESIRGTEYSATFNYTVQEKLNYRLSYAQGTDLEIDEKGVADTGYTHVVLGANYRMSEKSKAFIDYGQVNWTGKYSGTSTQMMENTLALGMTLDI